MNENKIIFLRRLYKFIFNPPLEPPPPSCLSNKEEIQKIIYDKIISDIPLMVTRFGSIELTTLDNALVMKERRSNWGYISWKTEPNYFRKSQATAFCNNAGFFPYPNKEIMFRFLELMKMDMREVDVLGSWRYNERLFEKELKKSVKVDRELMTPLLAEKPWTLALEGKKVLVVHPFAETIKSQYARIDKVFPNEKILPRFQLTVFKAVQTAGGGKTQFKDWFEALQYMKDEIDKIDYDVCLLGCGAYGFPLAAHCKRRGKQAIHLGGVLQLLFGIKGKRWETEGAYLSKYRYIDYYNDYWVRPSEDERPCAAIQIENGCYW